MILLETFAYVTIGVELCSFDSAANLDADQLVSAPCTNQWRAGSNDQGD